TNAAGEYALKGFPLDGVLSIAARAEGYGYRSVDVRQSRKDPIPARVDLLLSPSRSARGRILDERGRPIEGAYVAGVASVMSANDQLIDWIAVRSRADGTFELRDLRPDVPHA